MIEGQEYIIKIGTDEVPFMIENYEPGIVGNKTGHPDTWTEGEPFELEFYANSDSELLNEYINNDVENQQYIHDKLIELILLDIKNSNDELQSEKNYENKQARKKY